MYDTLSPTYRYRHKIRIQKFLTWIRTLFFFTQNNYKGNMSSASCQYIRFFSSPSRPTSHPGSVYNTDPDPIHILINHPALCQFRLSIHNLFSLLRVRIQRSIELSALSLPAASAFLLYSTRSNLVPNHFHIRSSYELDSQKISFCLPPKYLRIRKVRPQGSARQKMSKIRFFPPCIFLSFLVFFL